MTQWRVDPATLEKGVVLALEDLGGGRGETRTGGGFALAPTAWKHKDVQQKEKEEMGTLEHLSGAERKSHGMRNGG